MNIIRYPDQSEYDAIVRRPEVDLSALEAVVSEILARVERDGDEAIREYERQFDHADLSSLTVSEAEFEEAEAAVTPELRHALELAHQNIATFHAAQRFEEQRVETCPGVTCWQRSVPIESVGLYVPGGTAPLFSTVLMLATPARIAGCKDIVLCTPPSSTGKVNHAILVAARIAGVSRVFKIGGVQAIAAMSYGTSSVPKVSKIFGPGNRYVMAAKQAVSMRGTAIDMPAGPSEVCVVADAGANPRFVAADLLSQAEHGPDSQVLLVTTSADLLQKVQREVDEQLQLLPRKDFAEASLANSRLVLVHDMTEAMALVNRYAPEHLILQTEDFLSLQHQVVNAGGVFLGPYACESAGDYASGTNHTLPTHGYATAYSGVNLDSFCRKITFQHLSEEGIVSIGKAVELMAEAEQLHAHRQAMTFRREAVEGKNSNPTVRQS
ncbi:MAG: histidinol dehydrogenase [Prevotella sp.]|nr:histidinol dehydrogenase [Prevotella sp.]